MLSQSYFSKDWKILNFAHYKILLKLHALGLTTISITNFDIKI